MRKTTNMPQIQKSGKLTQFLYIADSKGLFLKLKSVKILVGAKVPKMEFSM